MEGKQIIDKRINSLTQRCANKNIRSLFVIHGSKSIAQIMPIYLQISSAKKSYPSILWCHKNYSKYISNLRKTMTANKTLIETRQIDLTNNFNGFLASCRIRFCSFDDSASVLGNTYDICIIQDFKSITPNILCRVVETVSGGGAVIIIFSNCLQIGDIEEVSLKMHNNLITSTFQDVYNSYMKRFLLSLKWCKTCLVLNDDLNVLAEFSAKESSFKAFPDHSDKDEELENCINNLEDTVQPLSAIVKLCKTIDQAKAVISMVKVLTDKSEHSTVSLTASRGRGKSAALGLATAAAIHLKRGRIFAVAPSPDNLTTFFEFVLKGFDALGYLEDEHYSIYQSVNPNFNNAIISIKVNREIFQYVQYLEPIDHKKLSHANLVVIDEAAAIPLTQVKALLGPYNVLMASTINGYEGTGRCFSHKLLTELKEHSVGASSVPNQYSFAPSYNSRPLIELSLEKSVRYATNDPVESWLYKLLCLNATSLSFRASHLPAPVDCELYYVNKKFLFSGCPLAETFLSQIMSLLVASHYKNKPDDLLILSDSKSHHLFVLVSSIKDNDRSPLPTIFSVLQICCEGGISAEESKKYSSANLPSGDLVPWALHRHFRHLRDPTLTAMNSVRIVRIATNPDYQSMGYGSKAVKLLIEYYKRDFIPLESMDTGKDSTEENTLLSTLMERTPEFIDYISVSYGLTAPLYKFWKKLDFSLIHLSQHENEITGECNSIMIYPIEVSASDDQSAEETVRWPIKLYHDFGETFKAIIRFEPLRHLDLKLATNIMIAIKSTIPQKRLSWDELQKVVSSKDILRLGLYAKRQADRFLIMYMMSDLGELYLTNKLHLKSTPVELSFKQCAFLVSYGFQGRHAIEEIAEQLDCTVESALALLNRTIAIIYKAVAEVQKTAIREEIIAKEGSAASFLPINVGDELDEAIEEFTIDEQAKEAVRKLSLHGNTEGTISIKRKSTTMTEEDFRKAVAVPAKKKKFRNKRR